MAPKKLASQRPGSATPPRARTPTPRADTKSSKGKARASSPKGDRQQAASSKPAPPPTPKAPLATPKAPAATPKAAKSLGAGLAACASSEGSMSRSMGAMPSGRGAAGATAEGSSPSKSVKRLNRKEEMEAMLSGGSSANKIKKERSRKAKLTGAGAAALEEEAAPYDASEGEGAWTAEKWVASLGLHDLIASALCPPSDERDGSSPFEHCKALSREAIESRLKTARLEGLLEPILAGVGTLNNQVAATGSDLNNKFHMEGTVQFEMAFGSLDLFFGGLEGVIGPPTMVRLRV